MNFILFFFPLALSETPLWGTAPQSFPTGQMALGFLTELGSFLHGFHSAPCTKSSRKSCNLQVGGLHHPAGESEEPQGSIHLIPAPCPAGCLGTERAVRPRGVKQGDLLGAKQEAEPRALVLIRWQ